MSVQIAKTSRVPEILAVIDSLGQGDHRLLHGVSWDEYEGLLDELGEGYGKRIYYDEGTLEIMAPLFRHEKSKELVTAMVNILADECDQDMEAAGSTTLKLKSLQSGAEPDTCFYIQHVSDVLNNETIDLRVDPPPDLVVEVDLRHSSRSKLKIYARFGVPEFWRYDGKKFEIFELVGGSYEARKTSLTFSFVKADDLKRFIEHSYVKGRTATLRSFRQWVRKNRPKD